MTRYTPMYEQLGAYTAIADRMFHGDILDGNAAALMSYNAFQVTQHAGTANMSVDVQVGRAILQGNFQANEGTYYLWSDAVENVTLTAAPGAGQERYDVIVAQVRNAYVDGGANTDFLFQAIQGTAAATGSATVPAIGTNQLKLAQVLVSASVTSILNAKITDSRPLLQAGVTPPNVTSGTTVQSFTDTNGEVWVAKNGVNGGIWKKARDVLHANWCRVAALSSSASLSPTNVTMDNQQFDDYGLYVAASNGFVVPISGMWRVVGNIGMTCTAANQWLNMRIFQSTIGKSNTQVYNPLGSNVVYALCATTVRCAVNDVITMGHATSVAGLAITVGTSYSTFLEVDYLGTG